jgi:hypothetical protein
MDSNTFVSLISGQETSRAILFSSLTIIIYDHFLLLSLEIKKIWKADGTMVKWIYIANRILNWIILMLGIISEIIVISSGFLWHVICVITKN